MWGPNFAFFFFSFSLVIFSCLFFSLEVFSLALAITIDLPSYRKEKRTNYEAGEGKKTKFWAPHPSGPHPPGPYFFWVWAPGLHPTMRKKEKEKHLNKTISKKQTIKNHEKTILKKSIQLSTKIQTIKKEGHGRLWLTEWPKPTLAKSSFCCVWCVVWVLV